MAALLFVLFIIVVFYWQIKRFKDGKRSRKKAVGLYAGYTLAPVILYGTVFFALVGIEELTHKAIISEGYARSLVFVIAGGSAVVIITTLVFLITLFFLKTED